LLFRVFPILRIPLTDIAEVRKASWWETVGLHSFFAARCGNRLWGPIVVIKRKRPFVFNRTTYITPDDPDGFIREVLRGISDSASAGRLKSG